jgi:hypothetical protein
MSTIGYSRSFPAWPAGAGTRAEGAAAPDPRPSRAPAWARDLVADRALWSVLLIWAFCWLAWAIYLERFANPLPWCDEYVFVLSGIATGERPLTWDFLWAATNEHRQPLTRLWCVGLGRLFHWNYRPMLQADLAVIALGCLPLILGARAARGRSDLADAFLPLLLLSSVQYESLTYYVYCYGLTLALWCATAGAAVARWPLRSVPRLLVYVLGALAVTWAGGPPGNLWALGLCVPLVLGCFGGTGRVWRACALAGVAAVTASSALLLYLIPASPATGDLYRSDSWGMTFRAAAKFSVGWLGGPTLQVLWPWALLVLAVPLVYLLARFLGDLRRLRAAALPRWADLGALLVTALLIVVAMGHGRARYPAIWSSRYCTIEIPIAAALYLLLARCAAPKALTGCLAVGLAVCVGWNLPNALEYSRSVRAQQLQLVAGLRGGHEPLSVLAERYPGATGWNKDWGLQHLVGWWQQMRRARISAFGKGAAGGHECHLSPAPTGSLSGPLHVVVDANAVFGAAVEAGGEGGTAVYEVNVPHSGAYRLCGRWMTPVPGKAFAVSIDDGPPLTQWLPAGPEYRAVVLETAGPLEAGPHRVTVRWPCAGSRLDVLELNPR